MKHVLLFIALCSVACAQKNDVGLFPIGNLNGGSFIHLGSQGGTPVAATYRSSMGGGGEYRRWITPRLSAGVWFEANPSEGELFTSSANPYIYDIALMRYEFIAPVAVRLWTIRNLQPFLEGGPGFIVTHGAQPGWSQDFAILAGGGADLRINSRWSAEVALTVLDAKQGCYGDPTCSSDWAVAQDVRMGLVFGW